MAVAGEVEASAVEMAAATLSRRRWKVGWEEANYLNSRMKVCSDNENQEPKKIYQLLLNNVFLGKGNTTEGVGKR